MSQPFAFPPPPPPPPKRESTTVAFNPHNSQYNHGGNRAAGGSFKGNYGQQRGSQSRGGRGYGRGPGRAAHAVTARENQRGYTTNNRPLSRSGPSSSSLQPLTSGSKRDHGSAFPNHPQQSGRPRAPPAVPSFEVDVQSILSKTPQDAVPSKSLGLRKSNLLGLTPFKQESESESDTDVDDEARLASTISGSTISFEHKGQTLSLSSPAEIAAWIAERRSKFPTQAKAEAAKQEESKKRLVMAEERKAREAAGRVRQEERNKERAEKEKQRLRDKMIAAQIKKGKTALAASKGDPAEMARQKAEKLRKRAERAARELQEAEEALRTVVAQRESAADQKESLILIADAADGHDDPTMVPGGLQSNPASEIDSEHLDVAPDEPGAKSPTDALLKEEYEDTSSSGSSASESESDGAPEEFSSRQSGPERVMPPKRTIVSNDDESICRNLLKTGKCKFGRKCRYSHQLPEKFKPAQKGEMGAPAKRKSLYQVMVEKEEEEDQKRALRAIIALGEQGMLDETRRDTLPPPNLQIPEAMPGDVLVDVVD